MDGRMLLGVAATAVALGVAPTPAGAAGWSPAAVLTTSSGATAPAAAVTPAGLALVAWNDTALGRVVIRTRAAGAAEWTLPLRLGAAPAAARPQLVADASGGYTVSWQLDADTVRLVRAASGLVSDPVDRDAPPPCAGAFAPPHFGVDAAGDVFVACVDEPGDGLAHVVASEREWTSAAWTDPVEIASDVGMFVRTVFPNGTVAFNGIGVAGDSYLTTASLASAGVWNDPAVGRFSGHCDLLATSAAGTAEAQLDQDPFETDPLRRLELSVRVVPQTAITFADISADSAPCPDALSVDDVGNGQALTALAGLGGPSGIAARPFVARAWKPYRRISRPGENAVAPVGLAESGDSDVLATWITDDGAGAGRLRAAIATGGTAWKRPKTLAHWGAPRRAAASVTQAVGGGVALVVWQSAAAHGTRTLARLRGTG
jgi:hypothetical protein